MVNKLKGEIVKKCVKNQTFNALKLLEIAINTELNCLIRVKSLSTITHLK